MISGIYRAGNSILLVARSFCIYMGKEDIMNSANLQKLIETAGKMALRNIWGENSRKINMAILKLDPENCAACTRLAKYYKLDDKIDEAENMYLKALEIDPDNRGAINNLHEIEKDRKENDVVNKIKTIGELLKEGQNCLLKGRYNLAAKFFQKAYDTDPSLKHAVSLAGAYKQAGRYDRIEKLYIALVGGKPDQADIDAIDSEFRMLRLDVNGKYEN
jgi:tetratricopeptide (TPR) repeat protein